MAVTAKKIIYAVLFVAAAAFVLGIGLGILWWGQESGWLLDGIAWIQENKLKGSLIVLIIYVPTSFPLIAGYALLTLACGFLFGFWFGIVLVFIGSQLGIAAVYFCVNFLFREKTEKFVEMRGGKYTKAIMKEIAIHRVKFAFFLRILPMPIGLQNCVLSISPIPFWMYQTVSGVGLLVKQIPEVYLGSTMNQIADIITGEADFSYAQFVPIAVGIAAVIIFVIFIVFISNRVMSRLKTMEEEELDKVAEELDIAIEVTQDEKATAMPIENEVFAVEETLQSDGAIIASPAPFKETSEDIEMSVITKDRSELPAAPTPQHGENEEEEEEATIPVSLSHSEPPEVPQDNDNEGEVSVAVSL